MEDLVPIQLPKENSLLDTTMGCLLQQMIESIQTAYVNGMPKLQAVQAWNKIFSLIWLHPLEQGKRRQCSVGEARSLMDFYSCKLIDCDQPNKSDNRNFDSDIGSGSFDSDVKYCENGKSEQYTEGTHKSVYEKCECSVPRIESKSPDLIICDKDGTMVPKCICVLEIKSELEKYHQNSAERQVIEYMLCHLHFQSKILGVLVLSTGFKLYKAVKNKSTKRIRIIQSQFSIVDDSKEDNFRTDIFKKFIHHLVVACEDISNDHDDIDIF
ncbi:ALG14 [Mytilus edulis]|uniref:ALG14 n=1 Tax=Mytilus edulis TaxID=6550 RepID=A0A8S3TFE9_MYTED|nr:ALG14 [Mytilus edulis]